MKVSSLSIAIVCLAQVAMAWPQCADGSNPKLGGFFLFGLHPVACDGSGVSPTCNYQDGSGALTHHCEYSAGENVCCTGPRVGCSVHTGCSDCLNAGGGCMWDSYAKVCSPKCVSTNPSDCHAPGSPVKDASCPIPVVVTAAPTPQTGTPLCADGSSVVSKNVGGWWFGGTYEPVSCSETLSATTPTCHYPSWFNPVSPFHCESIDGWGNYCCGGTPSGCSASTTCGTCLDSAGCSWDNNAGVCLSTCLTGDDCRQPGGTCPDGLPAGQSRAPTKIPTASPQPTAAPSLAPTKRPTQRPTEQPTTRPTPSVTTQPVCANGQSPARSGWFGFGETVLCDASTPLCGGQAYHCEFIPDHGMNCCSGPKLGCSQHADCNSCFGSSDNCFWDDKAGGCLEECLTPGPHCVPNGPTNTCPMVYTSGTCSAVTSYRLNRCGEIGWGYQNQLCATEFQDPYYCSKTPVANPLCCQSQGSFWTNPPYSQRECSCDADCRIRGDCCKDKVDYCGLDVTENPTSAPTNAPTTNPTKAPTNAPTTNPTKAPTNAPTTNPTKAPTNAPTTNPTNAPTTNPTKAPTNAPTTNPTNAPTRAPTTKAPTSAPTRAPTTVTSADRITATITISAVTRVAPADINDDALIKALADQLNVFEGSIVIVSKTASGANVDVVFTVYTQTNTAETNQVQSALNDATFALTGFTSSAPASITVVLQTKAPTGAPTTKAPTPVTNSPTPATNSPTGAPTSFSCRNDFTDCTACNNDSRCTWNVPHNASKDAYCEATCETDADDSLKNYCGNLCLGKCSSQTITQDSDDYSGVFSECQECADARCEFRWNPNAENGKTMSCVEPQPGSSCNSVSGCVGGGQSQRCPYFDDQTLFWTLDTQNKCIDQRFQWASDASGNFCAGFCCVGFDDFDPACVASRYIKGITDCVLAR